MDCRSMEQLLELQQSTTVERLMDMPAGRWSERMDLRLKGGSPGVESATRLALRNRY